MSLRALFFGQSVLESGPEAQSLCGFNTTKMKPGRHRAGHRYNVCIRTAILHEAFPVSKDIKNSYYFWGKK
jgi:hypothetical protein